MCADEPPDPPVEAEPPGVSVFERWMSQDDNDAQSANANDNANDNDNANEDEKRLITP